MKKLLFTLLVVAGIANAVTNTVVVEPSAYGYFTGHAPGTYTYTLSHVLPFVANEGYVAVPTLNGEVVNSSNVVIAVAATNGFYKVGVKAYCIKIEDTAWSKQSTKPAGTYYNVGTGIWTRCFWTSQTETFGGCTLNSVAVSPVTDNWYFISAPTSTNKTFKAIKASYSVTLTEATDCCVFYPTNGTYSVSDKTFTFKVVPKPNYGVQLIYPGVTNLVVNEQTFTIPISGNTTVTAKRNTASCVIKGGAFAVGVMSYINYTNIVSTPWSVTVAAASGCAIDKTFIDGNCVGGAGDYVIDAKKNHVLECTPVTITVGQNPVGASSPAAGVYTNGVTSFSYTCSVTNTAYSFDGVYFNGEKLTPTGGVYTVKATRPSYINVKSNKVQPSPSVGGIFASVTFEASGSWQYVTFTSPENFDPTTGEKILPHYGDAVMIQAFGGDIDVSQSTNLVSTIYTKTAPYQLELSPITIPDGNTLVINKPLPGIWFKGSGSVTISTVQR